MSIMRWSGIRAEHVEAIGREDIERVNSPASTSSIATSPPSEASSKSSPTSATNSSRPAEHRR